MKVMIAGAFAAASPLLGCGVRTPPDLTGTWTMMAPKSTVELDVNLSTIKNGKVVSNPIKQKVAVETTIQFTPDGFFTKVRRAGNARLAGSLTRLKYSNGGPGVILLQQEGRPPLSVTVVQEGDQLILESAGTREVFERKG